MKSHLQTVTRWLQEASSQVGRMYMQLPVAGQEEPEYRERVYCYELYHQWRSLWNHEFPFSLGGEIDKAGHALIRDAPKPDFLVHVPGRMANLLVVEVKPHNAPLGRIIDDLVKLTTFRRDLKNEFDEPANYIAAYLWIYNIPRTEWKTLRGGILSRANDRKDIDLSLVSCFIHEQSTQPAIPVDWQTD